MTFTYDETILSDLYKDAYGFRPRDSFYREWDNLDNTGKQALWDFLCVQVEASIEADKAFQENAKFQLEIEIANNIMLGAKDSSTAFRWIVESYDSNHEINGFESGMFCYQFGLPYMMEDELMNLYLGRD